MSAHHKFPTANAQDVTAKYGSPFTEAEHARYLIKDDCPPTVHARLNSVSNRWESPVDARDVAAPTLFREIDALGGVPSNDRDRGYCEALSDVLAILERRGFRETADTSPCLSEVLS